MLAIKVADYVHSELKDHGGVVVLDTKAGRWIALNATAGEFWRTWEAGGSFEQSVARVSAMNLNTPEEMIREDARRLVNALLALELIAVFPQIAFAGAAATMAESSGDQSEPRPRFLHWFAAFISLIVASLMLRCSFRTALAIVRLSHRLCSRRLPSQAEAAKTVAAVSRAARYYPGRAACLEQSLAAVLLASSRRRKLDWCLGSAIDPYRFHAWTEVGGEPVLLPGDKRLDAGLTRILNV